MTAQPPGPDRLPDAESKDAPLTAGLKRLARDDGKAGWHLGARLRNSFLTGLLLVGPGAMTLYHLWQRHQWQK